MKRTPLLFLQDILDSIHRIEEYIADQTFEEFEQNHLVIDGVLRNLGVIGEAAKSVPEQLRQKHSDIPWSKMIGLRNILIHQYFGIDEAIIWSIATENLPTIIPTLEQIIQEYSE